MVDEFLPCVIQSMLKRFERVCPPLFRFSREIVFKIDFAKGHSSNRLISDNEAETSDYLLSCLLLILTTVFHEQSESSPELLRTLHSSKFVFHSMIKLSLITSIIPLRSL